MLNLREVVLLSLLLSFNVFSEEITSVFVQGNEIHYDGGIRKEANIELFSLYKENHQTTDTVVIKSKGGDVNNGMDLAEFIFENQLNVKVLDYCLSSCANYVFPAGKNKILSNTGIVGFHGGLANIASQILTLPENQQKQVKKYIEKSSQREIQFYKKINVNREISSLGQSEYYQNLYGNKGYVGWYYSLDSLIELGVTNISVITPPWVLKQISEKVKFYEVGAHRT